MTDRYYEVKVHDRIWLAEKWIDVPGGYSNSQIVMTEESLKYNQDMLEGWTVTEYKRVEA